MGKTELISRVFSGKAEVISADSMQVYKHMDIGTAKPSLEMRAEVRHYMIDVAEPTCDYNAAMYAEQAGPILREKAEAGEPVIVTGGTAFYIRALLDGLAQELPPPNPELRAEIHDEIELKGLQALHDELRSADQERAEQIHPMIGSAS